MVQLTDYLYSGDTVLKILHCYSADLQKSAKKTGNQVDFAHANFLFQMIDMLEHNDFLTSQSQRIREFYKYMAQQYPYLAFTFHGRIKSLIRAEEKFNGYISSFIYEYYQENGKFPQLSAIKNQVNRFRDLIAYRIVISMPKCHLKPGDDQEDVELHLLYEIANKLPDFLEELGFTPEISDKELPNQSALMDENVRPYYKDYIANVKDVGYKSLHITLYDNMSRFYTEVQLRTKRWLVFQRFCGLILKITRLIFTLERLCLRKRILKRLFYVLSVPYLSVLILTKYMNRLPLLCLRLRNTVKALCI